MISRFHVKNYRSIVDLDLSFRYDEKQAPNGYREMESHPFLEDKTGRYVPCLAIYGPNAGGKTNIVRALNTFHLLVLSGAKCTGLYDPNKLHPELINSPTEMTLEWSDGESVYEYIISYTHEQICFESLSVDNENIYEIKNSEGNFKKIAVGEYTEERIKSVLNVECMLKKNVQIRTFLPRIVHNFPGLHPFLTNAQFYLKYFIHPYPNNNVPPGYDLEILEWSAANEEEKAVLREQVFNLIQRLDLDIKKIIYKKEPIKEDEEWIKNPLIHSVHEVGDKMESDSIFTVHHDTQGNPITFSLIEESDGTQLLFGICCLVVAALKTGRTIIIDEIDRSLHPLLLENIAKVFKDKKYNTRNAQLIFTTHSTELLGLNLFRVSEVAIVDKNLTRGTMVKRLSEFEDIRNVTDFRRRYLNGQFGGIPYPYL